MARLFSVLHIEFLESRNSGYNDVNAQEGEMKPLQHLFCYLRDLKFRKNSWEKKPSKPDLAQHLLLW